MFNRHSNQKDIQFLDLSLDFFIILEVMQATSHIGLHDPEESKTHNLHFYHGFGVVDNGRILHHIEGHGLLLSLLV